MVLASAAAILLAGGLIGATGIGGVLVVPTLTQIEGLALPTAVAASSLAFAFPGLAALWWLLRERQPANAAAGTPGLAPLLALVLGALPGAACGSLLVHAVDARWLMIALALLAVGSGVRSLQPARVQATAHMAPLGVPAMAALGLGVGVASALTGTGGPVILIPLLMALRQPLPVTLAAAQAIQLPVALCASAVHMASGATPLALACSVGLVLLAGSLLGQRLARGANLRVLQILVSLMLIATGLWFAWRAGQ